MVFKKSSEKLRFFMYADDTRIYFNLEDFDSYSYKLEINEELQKVSMFKSVDLYNYQKDYWDISSRWFILV